MERLYALGVSCIEFVQDWFEGSEGYFKLVNHVSNPHHTTEILFPLLSIVDSVFAAQLLLCMAFGGWLNAVMKWWLLEDRPYWWVRETSFYDGIHRPRLRQYPQTCETGPGSPSGHTATASALLVLFLMWAEHFMNDRKFRLWWWKYVGYTLFVVGLGSVMLARMYVATHFPHQCLLGALIGSFMAPALCLYVSDPCIWQWGGRAGTGGGALIRRHALAAGIATVIAVLTYYGLVACGCDPQYTIKLAFRWCETPEDIHVSTTPLYALVESTAYLLGWALTVTPAVARYRHNSKDRSILISIFATSLVLYGYKHVKDNICTSNTLQYYAVHYALCFFKPMLLLRAVPAIAMWPFTKSKND
ncbi:glucose-6-phosphatase catalytic subunit 1 isoform X1 [Bombyx mori]|uniref:glucose-6-phosphatase n=1 Tax=Bombyx mori TaxID=7091 RepID=A0A8R2AQ47_BOMMO|nr:glucose-6-phosphatase isoform X1 [Bombyx mori]